MKMNIAKRTKMTSAERSLRKLEQLEKALAWAISGRNKWHDDLIHHLPGAIIGYESSCKDIAKLESAIARLQENI